MGDGNAEHSYSALVAIYRDGMSDQIRCELKTQAEESYSLANLDLWTWGM